MVFRCMYFCCALLESLSKFDSATLLLPSWLFFVLSDCCCGRFRVHPCGRERSSADDAPGRVRHGEQWLGVRMCVVVLACVFNSRGGCSECGHDESAVTCVRSKATLSLRSSRSCRISPHDRGAHDQGAPGGMEGRGHPGCGGVLGLRLPTPEGSCRRPGCPLQGGAPGQQHLVRKYAVGCMDMTLVHECGVSAAFSVCISVSVSNLLKVARTRCHSGARWSSWFSLLTRCYSDSVDCSQVFTCAAQQMSVSGVAASDDPMCSWEHCKTLPNLTIGLAWFRCAVLIALISQCYVSCVLFTTSLGDMC